MNETSREVDALESAYGLVSRVSRGLEVSDFDRASRCEGWSIRDVLFHLLLDAQRALVTLAAPSNEAPDTTNVTYWAKWNDAFDPQLAASHRGFVQKSARAYSSPAGLVIHWTETADAAVRAARAADPAGVVRTQGHHLIVGEFLGTLVVEAVVHYLDMTVNVADSPSPDSMSLAFVCDTFDALVDGARPDSWDNSTFVLKATGREPLDGGERAAMGVAWERIPVLR